jgi:hypothetical protein
MVWPKRALYIYVSSRHGGCRASTALQPLQLLYSCSTALQLYIALHSTTSTLTLWSVQDQHGLSTACRAQETSSRSRTDRCKLKTAHPPRKLSSNGRRRALLFQHTAAQRWHAHPCATTSRVLHTDHRTA